jgi:hypothetical protein
MVDKGRFVLERNEIVSAQLIRKSVAHYHGIHIFLKMTYS